MTVPALQVSRNDDGTVTLSDAGIVLHFSRADALALGRAILGAAGYPGYRDDEPWLTLNRVKSAKLQAEKAGQS